MKWLEVNISSCTVAVFATPYAYPLPQHTQKQFYCTEVFSETPNGSVL